MSCMSQVWECMCDALKSYQDHPYVSKPATHNLQHITKLGYSFINP